jgi:integrase
MHDLMVLDPALPGTLSHAEMASTMAYAEAEKAEATRAAYDSDWKLFAAWAALRGATALPAHPGVVAAYLSHCADSGLKASTIGRRCAAIADRHRLAGIDPLPTAAEGVRAVLRGIRRTIGIAPTRKQAATGEIIGRMMESCPYDTLIGLRDRALLSFGVASAMRRGELAALTVSDLTWTDDGLRVFIAQSKTDQERAGCEIAIPRGCRLRPVEAVRAWLDAAGISYGPVFRAVSKGGQVSDRPMDHDSLGRVLKKVAARIGLDPVRFSAHSMRAGFCTTAAESGATVWKIQEVSRHKSLDVLSGYVRSANLFDQHAGSGWL